MRSVPVAVVGVVPTPAPRALHQLAQSARIPGTPKHGHSTASTVTARFTVSPARSGLSAMPPVPPGCRHPRSTQEPWTLAR